MSAISTDERREVATCTVESSHECDSELELLSLWKYRLSCEHTVYYNCQLPPSYCPECGKKVQFDAYDYI